MFFTKTYKFKTSIPQREINADLSTVIYFVLLFQLIFSPKFICNVYHGEAVWPLT